MFEVIHEFAVLGTACFMMALATVWYSPMLFGKLWMKETGLTDEMIEKAQPHMLKHMVLTFVSYVIMLTLLALLVVYAPKILLQPIEAAGLLALFAAAGLIPAVLFEGRSARYYAISVGFYVTFILLGTLMLQHWPW
ncbi:MAG: hypothetical protein ACI92I_000482 [Acidimicrobiales bacterium]|jgi:hypothetical protein